MHIVILIDKWV